MIESWVEQKDAEEVSLEEQPVDFKCPPVIKRLLKKRGLWQKESLKKFFKPTLSQLKDPFCLNGMEKAVDRLVLAFQKNEVVALYGDYDLDGTSGLALLSRGLKDIGFENVITYQPSRMTEGYGLHSEAIQRLKSEKDIQVLVTIDLGVTAVEQAQVAKKLGVDLIITDHHLPKEVLPECVAIVNPNTEECSAQLGHLCGTGVAFYLLWAMVKRFQSTGANPSFDAKSFSLKKYLDCFTIGTLTDMVPLIDENRVLVKHGLSQLKETDRAGLKKLMEKLGLHQSKNLSAEDVAIRFAPKINALSRMEENLLPLDLYLEPSEERAEELVKTVIATNTLRKRLQKQAETVGTELAQSQLDENFFLVGSPDIHKGVMGLVATKLSIGYQKPAFVASFDTKGQRVLGSARAPDHHPTGALAALESLPVGLLTKFGGHRAACGFELPMDHWDEFFDPMKKFFDEYHEARDLTVGYDVQAHLSELNLTLLAWFDEMGPFGVSNPQPILYIKDLIITQVKELSGGHQRISLFEPASQSKTEALWFSPPAVSFLNQGEKVEILGEVQRNLFRGRESLQIIIKSMRVPIGESQ